MFYSTREALAPVLNQYAAAATNYRKALYRMQSELAGDDLRMAQGHIPNGYVADNATRMVTAHGQMDALATAIRGMVTPEEQAQVTEFLQAALQGENVIAVDSADAADLPDVVTV